jgi:predicted phosphodiesterase
MRIGLIADTHLPSSIREPWPEVASAFRGVDLILHAGDIVTPPTTFWTGLRT